MCERLSEKEKLECSGGDGCCIYKRLDEIRSADKKDHAERSIANQPNHQKFWNKHKLVFSTGKEGE